MAGGTMRIGADVGGTFTDVVLETGAGMFSTKVLTTYDAPERGILDGVRSVVAEAGADLADLEAFIHGTTLATNALIGRTGARTALVTTAGFRDTIEMRTESRFEQYDLNLVLPAPLIERRDRHVLAERIGVDGRVLRPFDKAEARASWANDRVDLGATYVMLVEDPLEDRDESQAEWGFDGSYRFSTNWTTSAEWRYDLADRRLDRTGLGLQYRNECVQVGASVVRRFAWLEIPSPAKKQLVEASCDGNRIEMKLTNVEALNLYLDERLVDFRKVDSCPHRRSTEHSDTITVKDRCAA